MLEGYGFAEPKVRYGWKADTTSLAQLAKETDLIPLPMRHEARKAKVVRPLTMYDNVGTSLS